MFRHSLKLSSGKKAAKCIKGLCVRDNYERLNVLLFAHCYLFLSAAGKVEFLRADLGKKMYKYD